jgi:2-(3-amino-3-carboxypropyl)histidine synthase
MLQFDFEEERVKKEILKLNAKYVLIQLPEGLKQEALHLARIVEKSGALPIISADPCYGACDLAMTDAENLGVDLIIHFGHSKMVKHERVPTVYVEARAGADITEAVQRALPLLEKWHKIGLVTTVQHVQTLDTAREILIRAGKTVVIGDTAQASYPGQVVGCDCSNAKSIAKGVEAFLFIGGGQFHAIGIALCTSKPTIVADPFDNHAFSVEKEAEKIIKQRWASIEEARRAKTFGILVGLKPGQEKLEEALHVKRRLEDKGKAALLLAAREITPDITLEFPTLDAYVNTACPRISLDDASQFKKPVLTVNEALVVVGELSWEELCRKGLFEG